MIAIPIDLVEHTIKKHRKKLDEFASQAYQDLFDFNATLTDIDEQNYVDLFINDIIALVFAKPDELELHKNRLGIISTKLKTGKPSFSKKLVEKLGYKSKLRKDILPAFYADLGIKACVYCNSMLTISAKRETDFSGRFQADHYLSQNDYPCFSISLYNLYPCCGPCNNVKKKRNISFQLYSDDPLKIKKSLFKFKLDPSTRVEFLRDEIAEKLIVNFDEPDPEAGALKFDDVFGINDIYATQTDVAAELILKAKKYKPVYLHQLQKLIPDAAMYKRLLVGNYTEEKDLHKRPLAKYMMDIARDVGLIR